MKKLIYILPLLLVLFAFMQCKDQDEMYKKYIVEDGIIYPGKALNVKVRSGIERVEVSWTNIDPLVVKTIIYWDNYQDSIPVDIPAYADTIRKIVQIQEGTHFFIMKSFDAKGNASVPVEFYGRVYGKNYASMFQDSIISVATYFGNGLIVKWKDKGNFLYNTIEYTDKSGVNMSKSISTNESSTWLPDYASGLKYNVFYVPDSTALDTIKIGPSLYEAINNKTIRILPDTPCEFLAADFDYGGEGVGYHDSDNVNSRGYDYRGSLGDMNSPGVDIALDTMIWDANANEWLMYTVEVEKTGYYTFDPYLSVAQNGAMYALEIDGVKTNTYNLANNESWTALRWYHQTTGTEPPMFKLTEGTHKIKFLWDNARGFNLKALRFKHEIHMPLPKSGWSVLEVSDEEATDGGGKNTLIDGIISNRNYWTSQWRPVASPAPLPHWAIIDMASPKNIAQAVIAHKIGTKDTKTVKLFVGPDPQANASTWTLIAEGQFFDTDDFLTLDIPQGQATNQGRYLKLLLEDSYVPPYTSVSEITLYGDLDE